MHHLTYSQLREFALKTGFWYHKSVTALCHIIYCFKYDKNCWMKEILLTTCCRWLIIERVSTVSKRFLPLLKLSIFVHFRVLEISLLYTSLCYILFWLPEFGFFDGLTINVSLDYSQVLRSILYYCIYSTYTSKKAINYV